MAGQAQVDARVAAEGVHVQVRRHEGLGDLRHAQAPALANARHGNGTGDGKGNGKGNGRGKGSGQMGGRKVRWGG